LDTALAMMAKGNWDTTTELPMHVSAASLRLEYNVPAIEAVMAGKAVRGLIKYIDSKGYISMLAAGSVVIGSKSKASNCSYNGRIEQNTTKLNKWFGATQTTATQNIWQASRAYIQSPAATRVLPIL